MMKKVLYLVMQLVALIACNSNEEPTYDPLMNDMEIWMEYVKTTDGYSAMKAYTYSLSDTIIFSGLKNERLWFSIYSKSMKQRLLEWTDDVPFKKKYIIEKPYDGQVEFDVKTVMPVLYRKDGSKESVVFNLRDNPNDRILDDCILKNDDFYYNQGDPSSQPWYITIYKDEAERRQTSLYTTPSPAWFHNGYKESFISNNYCISMGDTLYEAYIDDRLGFGFDLDLCDGFSSYYTVVLKPIQSAYNQITIREFELDVVQDIETWTAIIETPFEVPDSAKPIMSFTLYEKGERMWKYKVDMLYYDGTKKHFKFSLDVKTGNHEYVD